jgi:quercetin dioxygenase-like cupin family protein
MVVYETARIADLEDASGWSPIRLRLDVRAFGVNAWTAHEAETSVIPDHDERPSGHEELYLVTAGKATFTVGGEEVEAPAGTIVFVRDPEVTRSATAREPGTTVVAVGGKPGEAYRPRAWEMNAQVFALLDCGEHAEAKRVLTDALERYEDRGSLFFNLACAEAQLGETEPALEHLRAAVEERPSLADFAREDGDLAPIRDDPRFAGIVGAS